MFLMCPSGDHDENEIKVGPETMFSQLIYVDMSDMFNVFSYSLSFSVDTPVVLLMFFKAGD